MSEIYRDFAIVRDKDGTPVQLEWAGDLYLRPKMTDAERDRAKLKEWEELYGKAVR